MIQWSQSTYYPPHGYQNGLETFHNALATVSSVLYYPNDLFADVGGAILALNGVIPSWNTAGRPTSAGIVGYNLDTGRLEGYNGTSWV